MYYEVSYYFEKANKNAQHLLDTTTLSKFVTANTILIKMRSNESDTDNANNTIHTFDPVTSQTSTSDHVLSFKPALSAFDSAYALHHGSEPEATNYVSTDYMFLSYQSMVVP